MYLALPLAIVGKAEKNEFKNLIRSQTRTGLYTATSLNRPNALVLSCCVLIMQLELVALGDCCQISYTVFDIGLTLENWIDYIPSTCSLMAIAIVCSLVGRGAML